MTYTFRIVPAPVMTRSILLILLPQLEAAG
jgi:hypothetical protein